MKSSKILLFQRGCILLLAGSLTFENPLHAQYPGGVSTVPLVWVKSNAGITQSGGQVSAWADQSPNGNNLVQATAATMPTYDASSANFNPNITFNGSQWLSKATGVFLNTTTYTSTDAYMVSTSPYPKSGRGMYGQYVTMTGTPTNARWMSHGSFSASLNYFGVGVITDGNQWATYDPARADVNPTIWSWKYASSVNTLRFNGGAGTGTGNTLGSFTGINTAFSIGAAPYENGGNPTYYTHLGTIPELIVFSTALLNSDRDKIESYMAVKYGITLTAHNYFSTAYTGANAASATVYDVSSYGNDVAGIGREDAEALHQRQSKSISSDALETIGLGTIAADNASNPNSLTNNTYMIWGNNNGAIAWQTTASPANRKRLTRQWKVSETGTVGSVLVRVPASTSTLATKLPAATTTVFLLTDADGDFTSGSTETPMTLNGTDWQATADFTNGQFFTFATRLVALPVKLSSFTGNLRSDVCTLNWSTANEANSNRFDIEHSTDGLQFNTIGSVLSKGSNQSVNNYSYTDRSPVKGTNYYRLKQVDLDGKFEVTDVIKIEFNKGTNASLSISPNPVINNNINLSLNNVTPGQYSLLLYNDKGQLLMKQDVDHNGSSNTIKLSLPSSLTKGLYTVQLQNAETKIKAKLLKD